jgi:hypothetical protein
MSKNLYIGVDDKPVSSSNKSPSPTAKLNSSTFAKVEVPTTKVDVPKDKVEVSISSSTTPNKPTTQNKPNDDLKEKEKLNKELNEFKNQYNNNNIKKDRVELDLKRIEDAINKLTTKNLMGSLTDQEKSTLKSLEDKRKFLKNEILPILNKNEQTTSNKDINTEKGLATNIKSILNFSYAEFKAVQITDYDITPNNNSLYSIIYYIFNLFKQNLTSPKFKNYFDSSINKIKILKYIVSKYIDDTILSENEISQLALNLNEKYIADRNDPYNEFYTLFNFNSFINQFQNGLILLYKLNSTQELYNKLNSKWFNNQVPDEYTDMSGNFNLLSLTRSEFEKLISKVIGEKSFNNIIESLIKNNYITTLYYPNIVYRKYIAQLLLTDTEYKANKFDILAIGEYFDIVFIELTEKNTTCIKNENKQIVDDTIVFLLYKQNDFYVNFKLIINDKSIILAKHNSLLTIPDIRQSNFGTTQTGTTRKFDITKICKSKNINTDFIF